MRLLLKSTHWWWHYIAQDRSYIRNTQLTETELRKLNINGWLHQLILAPLTAILVITATIRPWYWWLAPFITHTIYLRYGIRNYSIFQKRKQITQKGETV